MRSQEQSHLFEDRQLGTAALPSQSLHVSMARAEWGGSGCKEAEVPLSPLCRAGGPGLAAFGGFFGAFFLFFDVVSLHRTTECGAASGLQGSARPLRTHPYFFTLFFGFAVGFFFVGIRASSLPSLGLGLVPRPRVRPQK